METKFKEMLAEALEVTIEELDAGIDLDPEKNWDSIAHLSVISAIDNTFGVQIKGDDLLSCVNTQDLFILFNKYSR